VSTGARRALLALTALLALAAIGAAWWTQHHWDMQPCPWCVLQRLVFVAIAAAAVLGLLWPAAGAALAGLLALSGLAAALWQHFVAASADSCDLTLADRLMAASGLDGRWPDLFMATATCAEAKVDLFGLPYEAWSGMLFIAIALAMGLALRRR
jgi:disulfide bond formation protein DsbB